MTTAVLIPCFNEEATIAKVVADFVAALPDATVYVYDNNSSDRTSAVAADAGAVVRFESLPGKGNVVRRMFADVEADVYVLVDGDDTYDAARAPELVDRVLDQQLDMVVGTRVAAPEVAAAYPPGHRFGNAMFTTAVAQLFGDRFTDVFSGYRAFSRRFVKSFPGLSAGFEIETELTVHAIELRLPTAEIETAYGERPEGSVSKLRTIHDGVRILSVIGLLYKEVRPSVFFGVPFLTCLVLSLGLGVPLFFTFFETGQVPRFPTAIAASGLMVLSWLFLVAGLVLDSVARGRLEVKRMAYLALVGPNRDQA
ncbi:MAG: glycosyltransferase [Deltaproteobacteria bacterium]|nr:glycosyltransferase [Deltaproteobacteria bacterium]